MAANPEKMRLVWQKFVEEDKEAFAEIYNAFVDDLFRYGTKLCPDTDLVKDAIQEVFLDLFINGKKNRVAPVNLKFYLILALKRNLFRKMQKGRKSDKRMIDETDLFETQYSFEDQLIREESDHETLFRLNKALAQLPSKQKEAIYLRFNQSLAYNEISQILEISVESARKQVYRAVKSVRESFAGKDDLFFLSVLVRVSGSGLDKFSWKKKIKQAEI